MVGLDRRTFLLGVAATGLAAACGDDGDGDGPVASIGGDVIDPENRSGRVEFLVPAFPDGFRGPSITVAGIEQRLAFVARDDVDIVRADAPGELELAVTLGDTEVARSVVPAHVEGIITPYYPLRFTPPEPGEYVITAVDTAAAPVPVLVEDAAAVDVVQIGDPMRPVATPTFDDARGVEPICTRFEPCPFHAVSLDDALAAGGPTVLLVATPGYCQTDICGPVVDLLIDAVGERDDLTAVHAEVYLDPTQFDDGVFPETTPAVDTYALPFEPQLLVADATGTVVARLDATFDADEMAEALARV